MSSAATPARNEANGPQYGGRYPWIAMGVVLIGTFMVILDTTIVNVALPQIGTALDKRAGIEWVVTAYLLAVGIAQPPTGWLADRYGRKRLFIVSLALFTGGSLLAALSPSLNMLIVARIVQGLGGGALMPVGMAMVYELFPPDRRGSALGVWGVAAMAAPAFGPVIGGYIATNVSWHWLFLVNIPIGIIAMVTATRLLRDTGYRESRPFDATGLGLISAGLVVWLFTFAKAADWGWGSTLTIALLIGGGLLLLAFIIWEGRVEHPVINLEMFQVPLFNLSLVIIACTVVVQFGILVFLPLLLEDVHGLTAFRVGTMLVPMAIAAAITFPLGGRLTDRIGARIPVVVGSALLGVSAWILGHLQLDSPVSTVEVAVIIQGLGFGLAMMPNSVTGLNALPRRFVARATAIRQLNVRVAASFGVAVLATILSTRMGDTASSGSDDAAQTAYNMLFLIAAAVSVVATVLAVFLPGSERNRQIQAQRREEDRMIAAEAF